MNSLAFHGGVGMGPEGARAAKPGDQSFNDMVASLAQEAIGKGSTALLDDEMGSFGVPNPCLLYTSDAADE